MKIGLPVEIDVRDLNGKLWLALNLVEGGHEVAIGKMNSVYESPDVIEPDLLFTTGEFSEERRSVINDCSSAGSTIVYLDEEGGIIGSAERYQNRIYPEVVNTVDWIYSWGSRPAEITKRCAPAPDRVLTTGNPRFDLLQEPLRSIYDTKARHYTEEYGDFVLVNTNFGLGNHEQGEPIEMNQRPETIESDQEWHEYLCVEFITAIKKLSRTFSDKNFIVRPHPSENHETYELAFANDPTISVVYVGSVRPWIKAAEAILHNGCTTGIEAVLMDRPAIAYRPRRPQFEVKLPNEMSKSAHTIEELSTLLQTASDPQVFYNQYSPPYKELKKYISNIDFFAAEHISNVISQISDAQYQGEFHPSLRERAKRTLTKSIGDKNVTRIRSTGLRGHWSYSNQKFSYLDKDDLTNRVEKLLPYTGLSAVEIDKIQRIENGYHLSKT